MRVIFMGTPDFAVGTLDAIVEAGYEVVLVVTQPDKPKGRSGALQATPVKECALKHNLEVFQPRRIREAENIAYLERYKPDMIVVAAFGQILPKAILDMAPYGCINVHASLLPKYRGAAPIQWSILNGDEVTGITIQRMDEGVDTGDMIAKRQVRIAEDETGGSLFEKLAVVGAQLCVETMGRIAEGNVEYIPQDHSQATHVSMIGKELGHINWKHSAAEIERYVRGLNPWPSAYSVFDGKTFKIWKAKVHEQNSAAQPGYICKVTKDSLFVQTGEGMLELLEVQLEGKKRMEADAFLRGYHVEEGTSLR